MNFIFFNWIQIRWLVRVFDSVETMKEGWIPASILENVDSEQQTDTAIYGDRANDAAYRRQYSLIFFSLIKFETEHSHNLYLHFTEPSFENLLRQKKNLDGI